MLPGNSAIASVVLVLASLFSNSVSLNPQAVPASPEKQLLELVNRERAGAKLPPLAWDAGLARAARAHALAMAAAHELSHQLRNESSLPARLAAASSLRMDAEGENVAVDVTVEGAHRGLIRSPPHRENILDAHFNYAGFATVWDKGQLWVVEDFAHAGRTYSTEDAEGLIGRAIDTDRERAKLQQLRRVKLDWLPDVACGMAQADSLKTSAIRELSHKYTVITYTQTDPSVFPLSKVTERPDTQDVSVAVCFARTTTYPGGVYWVIVLFY
jgi:Cysteine-rich secretory protein family